MTLSMAAAAALALLPSHPGAPETEVSRARYLMGTVCEGTVLIEPGAGAASRQAAAGALEAAFDEIDRLERILSDWKNDSELSRLNREAPLAPASVSADLHDFLKTGARLARLSGGAFDLTVGPLVRLYDLRGAGRWPSPAELDATREAVGFSLVRLDAERRTVRFGSSAVRLDPGALGKGYALDAAGRVLRARGFETALLDFGGQVLALGAPAGRRGWPVAVAHPLRRDEPAVTLLLKDASLATSANAERGLIVEGRALGHVIDPLSGRPVSWSGSASALAATAAEADAFSTALLVMGPDSGLAWAAAQEGLTAFFLREDERGRLTVRPGPGFHKHDAAILPSGKEAAFDGGS